MTSDDAKTRMSRILFPVFGILLTIFVIAMKDPDLPKGFNKRVLALEFARNQTEVDTLAGGPDLKSSLRRGLWIDSTVVVPIYWLFFISIGAFMYGRYVPPLKLWLLLLPLVISIAAVADLLENLLIMAAFDARPGAESIHLAAYTKWAALGLSCALVAVGLITRGWRALPAALVYLGVAAVMVNALFVNRNEPGVEIAFAMMGAAVALSGEAFEAVRRQFFRKRSSSATSQALR